MDIARVNSIFPNDVLALMPSTINKKEKRVYRQTVDAAAQTYDVPFIKIYDMCKL